MRFLPEHRVEMLRWLERPPEEIRFKLIVDHITELPQKQRKAQDLIVEEVQVVEEAQETDNHNS